MMIEKIQCGRRDKCKNALADAEGYLPMSEFTPHSKKKDRHYTQPFCRACQRWIDSTVGVQEYWREVNPGKDKPDPEITKKGVGYYSVLDVAFILGVERRWVHALLDDRDVIPSDEILTTGDAGKYWLHEKVIRRLQRRLQDEQRSKIEQLRLWANGDALMSESDIREAVKYLFTRADRGEVSS